MPRRAVAGGRKVELAWPRLRQRDQVARRPCRQRRMNHQCVGGCRQQGHGSEVALDIPRQQRTVLRSVQFEAASFDLSSPPAEAGAVVPPRLLRGASIGFDPGGCGVVPRFFAESQQPRDGLQRHEQDDRAKEHF